MLNLTNKLDPEEKEAGIRQKKRVCMHSLYLCMPFLFFLINISKAWQFFDMALCHGDG